MPDPVPPPIPTMMAVTPGFEKVGNPFDCPSLKTLYKIALETALRRCTPPPKSSIMKWSIRFRSWKATPPLSGSFNHQVLID